MTTLLTAELIDRCHAGSRAKGFWDETPPQGQQLMLVVSELAESLEAHRKGRTANFNAYHHACDKRIEQWEGPTPPARDDICCPYFESYIKDTVGDELADAYIRLCDFAGGFSYLLDEVIRYNASRIYWLTENKDYIPAPPVNFGFALLLITRDVCDALSGDTVRYADKLADAMASIEKLCEREGTDLATHIDLKLRYNATRPAKHGKAY